MSYILDALRKADAERRGAPLPVGQAEPALLVDQDPDGDLPPSRARPWLWVMGGLVLSLAAVGAGSLLWPRASPAPESPVALAPAPEPAAPEPEPSPPPPPGPSADALPNFPPPLPDAPKPEAPKAERRVPLPDTPSVKPAGPPPGIAVVPPAAAGTNRIYNVAELPEDVRRDLPKLNVGGAMYSERAADRMVVLNGQVFHEGDSLGKGITLKQIRLKSAVLEFRGYRVEVGF